MSRRKSDAPSVACYADHEVITPPNKLVKAVSLGRAAADDPVARAELALEQLSAEFSAWMNTECERLDAARHAVMKDGFNGKTRGDLFHAAHDIKGQAATFGFPSAGDAAESLCRLIEHTPDVGRIPLSLINQHVDAVRAIIREHASDEAAHIAAALARRLREVTDDFLRHENAHRPEYLEAILGPPLAPSNDEF